MRPGKVRITSIVPQDNILPPDSILAERWVYMSLVPIITEKFGLLEWLARHRLIANTVICDVCNRNASLVKVAGRADGYRWSCAGHKFTRTVRYHSFFEGSHLCLRDLVMIIYMWSMECSQARIMHELGMNPENSQQTIIAWCKSLRELCEEYIERNPQQLGGFRSSGTPIIVEIDEAKFFPRKYHRGRWRQGEWVLGAVERHSGRCCLLPVPDRTRESVYPLIRRWFLPGTRIVSEGWAAYIGLEYIDGGAYTHDTVVHQRNSLQPGPSNDSGFVHQRNTLQPGPSADSMYQRNSLQSGPSNESMLVHQRNSMQQGPSVDSMLLHQWNSLQPGPGSHGSDSMLLHQRNALQQGPSDGMQVAGRLLMDIGDTSVHQWNSLQSAQSNESALALQHQHQRKSLQSAPSGDSGHVPKKRKSMQSGKSDDNKQSQNTENTWIKAKRKLRLQKKSQDKFPSYINEYLWRNRMKANFFESIIMSIGNVYVFEDSGAESAKEKIPSPQESGAVKENPLPQSTQCPSGGTPQAQAQRKAEPAGELRQQYHNCPTTNVS